MLDNAKQLLNITNFAYQTVPFYREKHKEIFKHDNHNISIREFKTLPIVYKSDLLHTEEQISEQYVGKYVSGQLIKKTTSGSTGRCLKVVWSLCDDLYANKHAWKLRSKWYGISPRDPNISFHTTLYIGNRMDKQREIIRRGKNLSFNKLSLSEERLSEHLKLIEEHKPVWIMAQPSVMNILCNYIAKNKSNAFASVKYIELSGEYLHQPVRDFIQQTFPGSVIANMYGAMEVGVISLECPFGHNHVLESNVYIETLDNVPDSGGNVVITSLRNTVMPFIRYFLGDRIEILPSVRCECGYDSHMINILAGRSHENITVDSGEYVSPYILLLPIETINESFRNPLRQFQVSQLNHNEFEVDLELKQGYISWSKAIRDKFLEIIHPTILGNASWNIRFVDHIPLNKHTGKLSFFQNLMEKE